MSGLARRLLLCLAIVPVFACENDVALQLLPKRAPVTGAGGNAGSGGSEPVQPTAGEGGAPDPDPCPPGDPCSTTARLLYFKGPYDRVEVPSSPQLDVPQDFAIEAWVRPMSYTGGHFIFNRWQAGVGDLAITFGTPEPLTTAEFPSSEPVPSHQLGSWAYVGSHWLTAVAPTQPELGLWHHLAVSYGGGSYRMYVDGKLVSSMSDTNTVINPPSTLFLGASARSERKLDPAQGQYFWPPLDGFIADVRISSENRYTDDFEPELRLSADDATLALFKLDEGDGDYVADSGPGHLVGTVTGATWMLAPRREGPSAKPQQMGTR